MKIFKISNRTKKLKKLTDHEYYCGFHKKRHINNVL